MSRGLFVGPKDGTSEVEKRAQRGVQPLLTGEHPSITVIQSISLTV
jgi:hypothetical protein